MNTPLPIQPQERTVIVDVLRGFALFGVLLGNFSGTISNNVPATIIGEHSGSFDHILDLLHSVFIQNKFMTLFSILFGYGFGVIMERLEKKGIQPTAFFLRRMFWLFVFGCINLIFWNGDILHVYAITGIFLLLFRKKSNRTILICSFLFLLIVPFLIRLGQQFLLHYSVDESKITLDYYNSYKFGSLSEILKVNYLTYPKQWIFTWVEWRDISETLGRFLLGYYLLRRRSLLNIEQNLSLIRKTWRWALLISTFYVPLELLIDLKIISAPRFILYPFLKIGILMLAVFYASSLVILYHRKKSTALMQAFRNLGCMALTNYLMHTFIFVIVFYGIGFGLIGEFSFSVAWASTIVIYVAQSVFSKWWLGMFYYGPVEWIWRQLTYKNRFPIKRQRTVLSS